MKPTSSHNEIQHFIEEEVPSQNDDSPKHEENNHSSADEHPAKEDHSIKTEELEKKRKFLLDTRTTLNGWCIKS